VRLANLIARGYKGISDITITLDSHHRLDIAHPTFWMKADGSAVAPFTPISAADVRGGVFRPRNPKAFPRCLAYIDALESTGRYGLFIWPIHCEIGTWGHNVHADVRAAYSLWEDSQLGIVNMVTKGSNPWTEHYSAVMAEVPDSDDPSTQLNRAFIDTLIPADRLYIAGEAGSHCVKSTVEHICDNFGDDKLSKITLITDCMSAVTGFDAQYESFLKDMTARGLKTATAAEVLPELISNA
jgi:nicotinamidase/pyrazinamidase